MKKIVFLISTIMIAVVTALFADASNDVTAPFSDVTDARWYGGSAVYVYAHGYFSGTADGVFSPDVPLTRAMTVTVLKRVSCSAWDAFSDSATFVDVPKGTWYHNAVEWAYANGITDGTGGGAFSPNAPVTRETLVLMLYKLPYPCAENKPAVEFADISGFADHESVSEYAKDAMMWAVARGIVSGTDKGTLDGAGRTTRAQAAAMIEKYARGCGHDWGEAQAVIGRTCTSDGVLRYECKNCGAKSDVTISGYHLYDAVTASKPTCTSDGKTDHICRFCGDKYTTSIPATGVHTFGAWSIKNAASASATGTRSRTCTGCGKTESKIFRWSGYYQLQSKITLPSGGYNVSTENIGLKVIYINKKLLGTTGASYTSATKSAVKSFQRKKGLPQTGTVDLATWKAMGYTEYDWYNLGTYVTPMKVNEYSSKQDHIDAMISVAREYADARTAYRIGCSGKAGTYADCSGLIFQCLYAVGIDPDKNIVDHARAEYEYTSRDLAADPRLGMDVAYKNAKAGDLLFYAKNGATKVVHVALYAGKGKIYDAWPNRGTTYRSAEISGYHVVKATRIFP